MNNKIFHFSQMKTWQELILRMSNQAQSLRKMVPIIVRRHVSYSFTANSLHTQHRKIRSQQSFKEKTSCAHQHCCLEVPSRGFCFLSSPCAKATSNFTDSHGNFAYSQNEANPLHDAADIKNDATHSDDQDKHIPVMVEEILTALQPQDGQVIVDMTFGAGGHAREIMKVAPGIHYYAADRDPLAFGYAAGMASEFRKGKITPILSRFSEIPYHLITQGVQPGSVDAFLFDLGASSMQFDTSARGFSLSRDGPLDMRMDGNRFPETPTAADIVNSLGPQDLGHILKKYGEESKSLQIAHAIVEARYAFGKFTRTKQLADVIQSVFDSSAFRHDKMYRHAHVATRTFQALRIFVNDELNEINNGLEVARYFLKPNGKCAVISFHSLEDRIVKRHFHDIDIDEDSNKSIHDHFRNANVSFDVETIQDEFLTRPWKPLSRKVMEPSESEAFRNPRSRSAKLRVAIKQDIPGN